jgi:predicted lipoprotein with Yx(FWY)xxD motif
MRNRLLRNIALSTAVIAVGASGSAAVAMAATTTHSAKSSAKVALKVAQVSVTTGGKTAKSSVLVNGSGDVVYLLTGDSTKHPECATQSCLGSWPAVTSAAKPSLGSGITGKVAVWHHNGINQLTIAGHPLYTFAGDGGPGVAHGQGLKSFGGTWLVVAPSGAAASASAKSSSSGSGSSGSAW